jgi:pimeloyl-ACP methyl ester carboxylesterase
MDGADLSYRVDGIGLHLTTWAADRPGARPLLLLHGLGDSWRAFARVAPLLAVQRPVYALDLRGHGRSDKPASGYTVADYARDVVGLLPQLGTPHLDLLGHSLGAAVALHVAVEQPERVAHLILSDPPIVLDPASELYQNVGGALLALKHEPWDTVVAQVAAARLAYPVSDPTLDAVMAQDLIATADGALQALRETGLLEWTAWLERLRTPTLVLAADVAVGGMLRAEARPVLAAQAQLSCVEFPGCGHELALATPAAVVQAVSRFLD